MPKRRRIEVDSDESSLVAPPLPPSSSNEPAPEQDDDLLSIPIPRRTPQSTETTKKSDRPPPPLSTARNDYAKKIQRDHQLERVRAERRRRAGRCRCFNVELCPLQLYIGRCKSCGRVVSYHGSHTRYNYARDLICKQRDLVRMLGFIHETSQKRLRTIAREAGVRLEGTADEKMQVVFLDTLKKPLKKSDRKPENDVYDIVLKQFQNEPTVSITRVLAAPKKNGNECSLVLICSPVSFSLARALKDFEGTDGCLLPQFDPYTKLGSVWLEEADYSKGVLERSLLGVELKLEDRMLLHGQHDSNENQSVGSSNPFFWE